MQRGTRRLLKKTSIKSVKLSEKKSSLKVQHLVATGVFIAIQMEQPYSFWGFCSWVTECASYLVCVFRQVGHGSAQTALCSQYASIAG